MAVLAVLLVCCSPGRRTPDLGNLTVKLEVGTRAEVESAIKELGQQLGGMALRVLAANPDKVKAGKPAVEGLIRRLKGDDARLSKLAAEALRRIATQDAILALLEARQIAMILSLHRSARSTVRKMPPSPERTELLCYLGNEAEIRDAMTHPQERIRLRAARVIGNLRFKRQVRRPLDPKSIEALIGRLRDPAPRIRAAAADTLGLVGMCAKPALPHLGLRMYDPRPDVRIAAVTSISRIDKGLEALRYIRRGLKDKDQAVREAARKARRRCTLPECAR